MVFTQKIAIMMLETITDKLMRFELFFHCANKIKVSVLLIEVLILLQERDFHFTTRCRGIIYALVKFTQTLFENHEKSELAKNILDRDLENREVIEIMNENDMHWLLNNLRISEILFDVLQNSLYASIFIYKNLALYKYTRDGKAQFANQQSASYIHPSRS